MKGFIICFAFSLIVLLSGCRHQPQKKATAEEVLTFLEQEFQCKVPGGLQVVLLLPSNNCKNCVSLDYRKFSAWSRSKIHIFSFVTINHFMGFPNFHYDKGDQLIRLKALNYSNHIMVIRDRKLVQDKMTYAVEEDLRFVMLRFEKGLYGKFARLEAAGFENSISDFYDAANTRANTSNQKIVSSSPFLPG